MKLVSWLLTTAMAAALLAVAWLALPGKSRTPISLGELTTGALAPPAEDTAPAPSPGLELLRKMLPEAARRANADDVAAMTAFYQERGGPLLWVTESGYSQKGNAALAELRKADDWGLNSSDFTVPELPAGTIPTKAAAEAEIRLTLALLKYARYSRGGRIGDPSRISKLLDLTPPVRAPKLVLTDLAAAEAPDAYLRSLHPKHDQFEKLRQLLTKLRSPGAKEEEEIDTSADEGDREIVYGQRLQEAVAHLQQTDAPVPATAEGGGPPHQSARPAKANVQAEIDRILVNMELWRWMPVDLGKLYVWNNVPEFLTRVVKDGKIINSDRIVAGQPEWPTPIFSADMKTIVFNPSWGVPDGIKRKELWPLLRNSSSGGLIGLFTGSQSSQTVLDQHRLQVYYRGRPIDANQVDWSSVNIGAYEFRQPPGPTNVLGAVKFIFPNKHDVYMHDTPERDLFARSFRGLSHGCMRVGDPRRLAEILLAEDKGWSKQQVASLFGGGSREVTMDTRIPVHVTYFTAMVDYKGKLRTFGDLYALDGRIGQALLGRKVRFETHRFDDEVVAYRQQQRRRAPSASAGASTLTEVISDIFSP